MVSFRERRWNNADAVLGAGTMDAISTYKEMMIGVYLFLAQAQAQPTIV